MDRSNHGNAPRVYTVCDESKYLIIRNVPALGCIDELIQLFATYGPIEEYRLLDEEDAEEFTDVYWIKFVNINNARFAKRKLDEYRFLGNLLQVTYAPQCESISDTREKLDERQKTVVHKTRASKTKETRSSTAQHNLSRGPLLLHPSPKNAAGQYPKFPLEKLPASYLESDDLSHESSKNVIQSNQVSDASCVTPLNISKKYFPSRSMNDTVQNVRDKLDKISRLGALSGSDSQQAVHKRPYTPGASDNEEVIMAVKKRQDNRRRI